MPKPTRLIKQLLKIATQKDDLVLDFFAGSGTTGHAAVLLNKEQVDGSRRFILVQIPEATDEDSPARKAGFKTISEITIARNKANNPLSVGAAKNSVGSWTSQAAGPSVEKKEDGSETSSETSNFSSETKEESSERRKKSSERRKKSSERILDLIKNKPTISAAEIAMEIDMSARGVEKQIRKLRETGIIKRIGADFGGYWEIIER